MPVQESLGVHSVQESLGVHPVQESLGVHPVQESLGVHPVQESLGVHPVQESSELVNANVFLDTHSHKKNMLIPLMLAIQDNIV
jgi:hypothetical protein